MTDSDKKVRSERLNVWPYVILPPIILNGGIMILFAVLYAYRYATSAIKTPGAIQTNYSQDQIAMSIFIFFVEWLFAGLLLYKQHCTCMSIRNLFSRKDNLLEFRWKPAILLFILFNVIFIGYIFYLITKMPDLTYRDMNQLQIILFLVLTPFTAAFTEELIWRGHIIAGLEHRGKSPWSAITISAVSFALFHGIFLPDKLLVTFIIGIFTGIYYHRERNLLPLMITHWFVDVWSFSIFLLR